MTALLLPAALAVGAIAIVLWCVFVSTPVEHSRCQGCQRPIEPDEVGMCDECWRNLQW